MSSAQFRVSRSFDRETFAGVTIVPKIHDDRGVVSDSWSLFAPLAEEKINKRSVRFDGLGYPSYPAIWFASCATVRWLTILGRSSLYGIETVLMWSKYIM